MTARTPIAAEAVTAMTTASWTISIIGILIAAAIAWRALGAGDDLERLRGRWRRRRRGR
ncbi:MAG: hypothetical protein JST31_00170 [Actinobacteria bacterium]|nr:hypothetical protein [Actinomycetota bacterium]